MSEDVSRLKELLFENESRTLSDLSRRMDIVFERAGSPESFTTSVASVLDDALRQAEVRRHDELSHAIAPLIVQTIKTEIRGSQDELAEALYPSLGRMVSAYVASAIRDLMDEINRRLESNPFMLRLRSILSGRPVAELAFVEGQRLKVQDIFLIRRGHGHLIGHWPPIPAISPHDQRVSGILTAINEVATEAFDGDSAALRRIDLGSALVYLRASPMHLLAAKCSGVAPPAAERIVDEHFLASVERLRAILDGDAEEAAHARAVNRLLAELSASLETALAEQQAKMKRRRKVLSPAAVLFSGIALVLAAWAGWSFYASYATSRVRAIAQGVLAKQGELHGYPVSIAVQRRGREVGLEGLVPTALSAREALHGLRTALPNSAIVDRTTALPTGLDEARAEINRLQFDLSRLRTESARADAGLADRLTALGAGLRQNSEAMRSEIEGVAKQLSQATADAKADRDELKAALSQATADAKSGRDELKTALSQAEAARQADIAAVRSELARALEPTPRQRLEAFARSRAIFFTKDTEFRDAEATAAALDELAPLVQAAGVVVRVVGYTDEKGGEQRNTPLSQARAAKVVSELTGRGVDAASLVAVGRNDVQDLSPVLGEASPNRRVEFEIAFEGEGAP